MISAVTIVALVSVASLSVILINSYTARDPLQRNLLRPVDSPFPKTGTLVVHFSSNQNFSSEVSPPLNAPRPLSAFPLTVTTIYASVVAVMPTSISTDANGTASTKLLPGLYLLEAPYKTLRIQVPLQIYSGNTTSVVLSVSESTYPLLYSEVTDAGALPRLYVHVSSPTPVNDSGNLVTLEVMDKAGNANQVDSLVVDQRPPSQGTQWLQLEPLTAFDLSGAASAVLATWTYSSSVAVAPTVSPSPAKA